MTDTPDTNPLNRPNLISALGQDAWWLQPGMENSLNGQVGQQARQMTLAVAERLAELWNTNTPRVLQQLYNAAEGEGTKAHIRECVATMRDSVTIEMDGLGL